MCASTDHVEVDPLGTTRNGVPTFGNCYVCAGIDRTELYFNRYIGRTGRRCANCKASNHK